MKTTLDKAFKVVDGKVTRVNKYAYDFEKRLLGKRKIVGDCWLWDSSYLTKGGFGQIYYRRSDERLARTRTVHSAAYEHYVGLIPEDKWVSHTCPNRHCFNPDHLKLIKRG